MELPNSTVLTVLASYTVISPNNQSSEAGVGTQERQTSSEAGGRPSQNARVPSCIFKRFDQSDSFDQKGCLKKRQSSEAGAGTHGTTLFLEKTPCSGHHPVKSARNTLNLAKFRVFLGPEGLKRGLPGPNIGQNV